MYLDSSDCIRNSSSEGRISEDYVFFGFDNRFKANLSKECLEVGVERIIGAFAGFVAGILFAGLVGMAGFLFVILSGMLATTGESMFVSAYEFITLFAIAAPFLTLAFCTFLGFLRKWRFFSFGRPI